MNDLISRESIIGVLRIWKDECGYGYEARNVLQCAMDAIEELPSAQPERKNCETCRYNQLKWDEEPCDSCTGDHWKPERKKGKWIPFDAPWYQCSECGAVRENKSFMENFCPNCGCRMEGGDECESD